MNEKFPVHWIQEIIEKILERNEPIITLSTGKTPSGHIHLGILREIIICDSLRRILENNNKNVRSLLFLDDLDAAKRFPDYINQVFQIEHMGKPFALIPCPFEDCQCESYAHHFGEELYSTFEEFGIKNEIIWTHELYKTPEMLERIRISLDNTEAIKEILSRFILPTLDDEKKELFIEMQKTWMPVMVICEKCHKIQNKEPDGSIKPNRVISYDKEHSTVYYECPSCNNTNNISLNSGFLKLNWRIDWPAKWSIYKTTCEPAGKDHCVKGGSYDTGLELCDKIFEYHGPIKVPYEWLRLGDRDMKTSKGIVFIPKKYLDIADPEIFRMLILRTNPNKHISLRIEEMSQYYDYYERMEEIFYGIQEPESEEEYKMIRFIFPLIMVDDIPDQKQIKLPLRILIFLSQIQNILNLEKLYEKAIEYMKQQNYQEIISLYDFEKQLKKTEKWLVVVKKDIELIEENKKRAYIIKKIGIFTIPDEINKNITNKLNETQIKGISLFRDYIIQNENIDAEAIKSHVYDIAKQELIIAPGKLFQALYIVILGTNNGPQLGPLIKLLDKDWLIDRLNLKT